MRPYIRLKPFSRQSLVKPKSVLSSGDAALGPAYLDQTSVFESLRAYGGRIFLLDAHLKRLGESCAALGRALPFPPHELAAWLESALKESAYTDASLRLSLHWRAKQEGEALLFVREFHSHPKEWYRRGVAVRSIPGRRPSPRAQAPQAKTSQYVSGVMAYLDNLNPPHEFLFFGPEGTVAEGTVSNIFILKRKSLLTPSVASGILRGVTRDRVLELARKRLWQVVETPLTRHDLYTADECFLTNTSSEVLPVVWIDGRRIGDGRPGRLTQALAKDFKTHHESAHQKGARQRLR